MRCRRLVLAVALPCALTACGATATGTLDAGTAGTLDRELAAVRGDASRGARAEALAALNSFRAHVDAAGRAGRLTLAERAALDTGIARVRRTLGASPGASSAAGASTTGTITTAPPATTATAAAPTAAPADGHGDGHGKGEKHGDGGGQSGNASGAGGQEGGD